MKNLIKVERARHDLTQAQLADKLGVSRQTIHAISWEFRVVEDCLYNPSTTPNS